MINWTKFFKSLGFAFQGIITLIKTENNAKIHFLATVIVIFVGFYFEIEKNEWLWVFLAITLVWATEAINTAIEAVVDLASPTMHPLAKKAKDVAAAAVLICSLFAIIVACSIFFGYIF